MAGEIVRIGNTTGVTSHAPVGPVTVRRGPSSMTPSTTDLSARSIESDSIAPRAGVLPGKRKADQLDAAPTRKRRRTSDEHEPVDLRSTFQDAKCDSPDEMDVETDADTDTQARPQPAGAKREKANVHADTTNVFETDEFIDIANSKPENIQKQHQEELLRVNAEQVKHMRQMMILNHIKAHYEVLAKMWKKCWEAIKNLV